MRLLLVEDDERLGTAMRESLLRPGYAVDWVRSGAGVMNWLSSYSFDCVLLDLGLPGLSGEQVLKAIRQRQSPVAVIVTTARGGVHDRINLLDLGADDYMVKPVDLDELASRVRAVLRRAQARAAGDAGPPEHGPLKLFPTRRIATWHGQVVPLTNKEFWLLETFVRHKGQVLTRTQIEQALYDGSEQIASNAVEVYVHYLRRKFSPKLIETVRGLGYQLGCRGLGA